MAPASSGPKASKLQHRDQQGCHGDWTRHAEWIRSESESDRESTDMRWRLDRFPPRSFVKFSRLPRQPCLLESFTNHRFAEAVRERSRRTSRPHWTSFARPWCLPGSRGCGLSAFHILQRVVPQRACITTALLRSASRAFRRFGPQGSLSCLAACCRRGRSKLFPISTWEHREKSSAMPLCSFSKEVGPTVN